MMDFLHHFHHFLDLSEENHRHFSMKVKLLFIDWKTHLEDTVVLFISFIEYAGKCYMHQPDNLYVEC